jgi:hypothetical protein
MFRINRFKQASCNYKNLNVRIRVGTLSGHCFLIFLELTCITNEEITEPEQQ